MTDDLTMHCSGLLRVSRWLLPPFPTMLPVRRAPQLAMRVL